MSPFWKKILTALGLGRRSRAATKTGTGSLQPLVAPVAPVAPVAAKTAHTPGGDIADPQVPGPAPVAPPVDDRPGRFEQSSFTGPAGTRFFKLFEPAGDPGRALPMVVMLHGCTQDPDDFAAGTRMNVLAGELGWFVLYPAQSQRANVNRCWNWFSPGNQHRGQGEPALIAGITRHVIETHRIDPDRVFVAGLSAGAAMAAILGREYPDLYAAVGIHSGLAAGAAHDMVSAFAAMKNGARPGASPAWPVPATGADPAPVASASAPVIVFHGDADQTVNVANGSFAIDAALGSTASWQARRESGSGSGEQGHAFTRVVYRAEDAPAAAPSRAEHWLVHGGGHAWFGGDRRGSYADASGPDASREMLRFFAEHTRLQRSHGVAGNNAHATTIENVSRS
ncbi:MAG: PHB depolymerase family esterase [Pseudomonadota bacterium]|nr:PHB depolymerase family esterase [Pseudomonadota bacterium]